MIKGKSITPKALLDLAADEKLMEVGRKAIESTLVEFREHRTSAFLRGNGLVIQEKNGSPSSVIRMGPEMAVSIALRAIAAHVVNPQPHTPYE